MTSGLTFKDGSLAVTIDGTAYTGGTFVGPTESSNSFTYTIPMAGLTPAGAPIVLTYKATLNDGAVTTDFERNTAYLEYSSNPYDEEDKDRTPDEHVWVIDLNIDVDKVDGEGGKLDGAKFKLYRNDGNGDTDWYSWDATNKKVVWTTFAAAQESVTDTTGKLDKQFQGLTQGTYHLRETEPPKGYNRLDTDPELKIEADDVDKTHAKITSNGEVIKNGTVTLTAGDHTANQPVAVEKVTNKKGTVLPSTGGIGTTLFYIIGGVLLIGAAVILVARRKAGQN
jgi:LPXTG-motif cell wall-anchored protein